MARITAGSRHAPKDTMKPTRAERAAWILEYFAETEVYNRATGRYRHDRTLGCTPTYDDELQFVDAWAEAFPGTKADPSLELASRRLRRLLNALVEEGLMLRYQRNNQYKDTRNDPAWQTVYTLAYPTLERIASKAATPRQVVDEIGWKR